MRRVLPGLVLSLLLTGTAVAAPPHEHAAHDHGSHNHGQPPGASPDRETPEYLYQQERKILGEQHAREHLEARKRALREGRKADPHARFDAPGETPPPPGPAHEVGRFETSGIAQPSPDYGVHVAVLPTGKVLSFSFDEVTKNPQEETSPTYTVGVRNRGRAHLWDPSAGTGANAWKSVPPPVIDMPDGTGQARPAPLFCTGMVFLPNGNLAVFGGNLAKNGQLSGARLVFTFDPWTETWHRQQDLSVGRWYPTSFLTPDGRVGTVSGEDENGWLTAKTELFPARNTPIPGVTQRNQTNLPSETAPMQVFAWDYPHAFTMADGSTYLLGRGADQQHRINTTSWSIQRLADRPDGVIRRYGPAVALPGGPQGPTQALLAGGLTGDPKALRLDSATGQWITDSTRAFSRNNDNLVLLPDGGVLSVNGETGGALRDYGAGYKVAEGDQRYRQVELYDPATKNWRLGPSSAMLRGYHSNAVLLADGRVLVTGDEFQQLTRDPDKNDNLLGSIEVYQPPNLFRGPRPSITHAPEVLSYGQSFTVDYQGEAPATRAVLVAPSASTHSLNTTQRHVELTVESTVDGRMTLRAPADATAALPGYHMLFLLTATGAPSVSVPVRFDPRAPRRATFTEAPVTTDQPGERCIDAAGARNTPGTKVQIWDCNGSNAQRISLRADGRLAVASGGCLDYGDDQPAAGRVVTIQDCGGDGQVFTYDTAKRALLAPNNLVLDVFGNRSDGGAELGLWHPLGNPNQTWTPAGGPRPDNSLLHTDLTGARCLDAAGGSSAPGTKIQLYDCNGSPAQRFTHRLDGRMAIGSGGCLDHGPDNPPAPQLVTVQPCGGDGQVWTYNPATRVLRAGSNGLAVDVGNFNPNNGADIVVYHVHRGLNQFWGIG
ncbi:MULTISPECIES: ricin-type beta-trefoil lectin domain protein [unclassified Crossiella]|uniref:ricin-type beta-trefoil lectin domain protein n=1 Tax=unclassified Crossiella TaxID=2620835 RepID=UPI001FFE37FC|nr:MULTISPECIES: ricin-type beta-trefoil lectin domain protein [unclassified Crossiella]MCK2237973.1 ricin-type beta-trefoil lectin domain protein [Crossiella sp. S99.2]MCK2255256.1 ricin-type beta-trefoil lectin domain protein [Crossiella sp. S99.1]